MMRYEDLPEFLQERVLELPEESRQPFLNMINQGWVDSQIACKELTDGIKDGRWTVEEVQEAARKSMEKE